MKVDLSKYQNHNPNKLKRLIWEIVWPIACGWTPRWCLNGWRVAVLRLFGAKIARGVRIQGSARIWQPWKLTIGENSWIDGGVKLYSVDEIKIGVNAVISEGAFVCTASHDIRSEIFELVTKPIRIGDMTWVCARAIVMPGVKIGEGAVVAAGAVVVKDVEPWTVAVGNPARVVGERRLR